MRFGRGPPPVLGCTWWLVHYRWCSYARWSSCNSVSFEFVGSSSASCISSRPDSHPSPCSTNSLLAKSHQWRAKCGTRMPRVYPSLAFPATWTFLVNRAAKSTTWTHCRRYLPLGRLWVFSYGWRLFWMDFCGKMWPQYKHISRCRTFQTLVPRCGNPCPYANRWRPSVFLKGVFGFLYSVASSSRHE